MKKNRKISSRTNTEISAWPFWLSLQCNRLPAAFTRVLTCHSLGNPFQFILSAFFIAWNYLALDIAREKNQWCRRSSIRKTCFYRDSEFYNSGNITTWDTPDDTLTALIAFHINLTKNDSQIVSYLTDDKIALFYKFQLICLYVY